MNPLFECAIPGRVMVKKNSQRVFGVGRSKRAVYSPQFIAWNKTAFVCIKRAMRDCAGLPIEGGIRIEMEFYFKNRHAEADVSNCVEGPQDVLQDAGVIKNDRQIVHISARKFFGGEPKTVIRIFKSDGP